MLRTAAIMIALSLATAGPAGDAKKPGEPTKDGYFKVMFEAKGVLKLRLDEKTRAIKFVELDGASFYRDGKPSFWISLDKNEALRDAAIKLDGKMVVATGHGVPFSSPPTGLTNGERRIAFVISALRATEEKK